MKTKVLFVEDDLHLQELLLISVMDLYEAEAVSSAEEALARISQTSFSIAILDVNLPRMSGLDLIPHMLNLCPGITIISISANNQIDLAVEAMKRGASDFLLKPFDLDKFLNLLTLSANRSLQSKKTTLPKETFAYNMVGTSVPMQEVSKQVKTIAPFNSSVLITGETGTGKELVAQNIHRQSPRAKQPFVAINCAAIPEQLLEDELFGHVKGAFTGAQNSRDGRFEQANGGTLFLDEIGDMNLSLQSKLLRVLQERKFEKLGASRSIEVDIRIVAATSANLEKRLQEGSFRPDLYYRLNVINIELPPLRERTQDIAELAEYFLARFCGSNGLPTKTLDSEAEHLLNFYNWPGNIRQLQNVMERCAILSCENKTITAKDLPKEIQSFVAVNDPSLSTNAIKKPISQTIDFDTVVTEVEKDLLCQTLRKTGGNKMQAAKLLNMKRTTFVEKLKRLGVTALDEIAC